MFHTILRNLREMRGYSQIQFAEMLGLPVTTYRNYENTLREPSYDILINMAKCLNVSVDELLGVDNSESKYSALIFKVKQLDDKQLQTLCSFTDFLLTEKSSK